MNISIYIYAYIQSDRGREREKEEEEEEKEENKCRKILTEELEKRNMKILCTLLANFLNVCYHKIKV